MFLYIFIYNNHLFIYLFYRERYRDLIQAADTIAEMEKTADNVVAKIVHIEDTFQKLQEKYLIGFKVEPPQSENKT